MPLLHPAFLVVEGRLELATLQLMKPNRTPVPQRYLARVVGFEPTSVWGNNPVPSPRRLDPNNFGGEDGNRTHRTVLAKHSRPLGTCLPKIGKGARIRTQTFGFGDRRATVNTTRPWSGKRDSNPHNVVPNHVCYR